jgi:serine/threonine protein kinase
MAEHIPKLSRDHSHPQIHPHPSTKSVSLAPVPSALASALRERYVLERELGRGGMAAVYLAQDLRHGRPVALKVLHPELAVSLGPERFQRERG